MTFESFATFSCAACPAACHLEASPKEISGRRIVGWDDACVVKDPANPSRWVREGETTLPAPVVIEVEETKGAKGWGPVGMMPAPSLLACEVCGADSLGCALHLVDKPVWRRVRV